MAIDLGADLMSRLTAMFTEIFTNADSAEAFAEDPNGTAEQFGLTGADLSGGVNVTQAAVQACQAPGVPSNIQAAVQSYAASPQPQAYSVQDVVEQVQQVTYVSYEDNRTIIDQLVENNTDINVDEDAHDITIDVDNLTQGDNSVGNTGNDATVAGATGDRANANNGDNATQNSGDGAVTAGGGSTIDGPVNTGTFTGVQGNNPTVTDTVIGNGNQVANVDGSGGGDVFIPFGSGNTGVQHSDISDSNVGVGGDAQNISHNDASEGGVIAGGDVSHSGGYTSSTDDHSIVDNSVTDDHSYDYSTHADNGSNAQGGYDNDNELDDNDDNDEDFDGLPS
jgi:hypothetical protein